jgi:hypothetical protein
MTAAKATSDSNAKAVIFLFSVYTPPFCLKQAMQLIIKRFFKLQPESLPDFHQIITNSTLICYPAHQLIQARSKKRLCAAKRVS